MIAISPAYIPCVNKILIFIQVLARPGEKCLRLSFVKVVWNPQVDRWLFGACTQPRRVVVHPLLLHPLLQQGYMFIV
jgi:hypothetical protein